MATWVESLDAQVASALSDWSLVTTLIAAAIAGLVLYPIFFPAEADTHPLLLARQTTTTPIRHKGESATYRSPEVPHSYPLKSGLNIQEVGQPRWTRGKDGDLRDVWREVQRGGSMGADGREIPRALIMTVFGKDELVEHDIDQLSKEIGIIGSHLQKSGAQKVAIYLPNSVEYLLTVFACAFYGLTPVLLPYNLPHPKIYELLNETGADSIVAAAGMLPLDGLAKSSQTIRRIVWVVETTSRHMDWNGVPDGLKGRLSVSVWHDVVNENAPQASTELPGNDSGATPGDLISVWQPTSVDKKADIITFTQGNLVAATGALISAIPLRHRLTSADLVLPADTFTHTYVLCHTLAALFMHTNIAINSVAAPGVDIPLLRRGIAPTIIISSAESLAKLHSQEVSGISSGFQKLGMYTQEQTMSAGRMPTDGLLFRLLAPSSTTMVPGKLRLIFVAERLGADSPPLTSTMLSDLRILTRARIAYALTASRVAGALTQTNIYDYRREDGQSAAHFGVPLSSVEFKLLNRANDAEVGGVEPTGELWVSGPGVNRGQAKLGVKVKVRQDGTLAYV